MPDKIKHPRAGVISCRRAGARLDNDFEGDAYFGFLYLARKRRKLMVELRGAFGYVNADISGRVILRNSDGVDSVEFPQALFISGFKLPGCHETSSNSAQGHAIRTKEKYKRSLRRGLEKLVADFG